MIKQAYKIDKEGEIQKIDEENKKKKERKLLFGDLHYLNIGFYIATPIIVGVILGIYLDHRLGTKPTLTISLIILGAVGSLYNLFKLTKK